MWHYLFTLISYFAIVFSFILMFTDDWCPYCTMAFCIVSVFWLSPMKQQINYLGITECRQQGF